MTEAERLANWKPTAEDEWPLAPAQAKRMRETIRSQAAELGALRQELADTKADYMRLLREKQSSLLDAEALRADAERYRWLRERVCGVVPMVRVLIMRRGQYVAHDRDLDAAIDAELRGRRQAVPLERSVRPQPAGAKKR